MIGNLNLGKKKECSSTSTHVSCSANCRLNFFRFTYLTNFQSTLFHHSEPLSIPLVQHHFQPQTVALPYHMLTQTCEAYHIRHRCHSIFLSKHHARKPGSLLSQSQSLCSNTATVLLQHTNGFSNVALSFEADSQKMLCFERKSNHAVVWCHLYDLSAEKRTKMNVWKIYNIILGQVQTPYFTWAESNANEKNPLFSLICI